RSTSADCQQDLRELDASPRTSEGTGHRRPGAARSRRLVSFRLSGLPWLSICVQAAPQGAVRVQRWVMSASTVAHLLPRPVFRCVLWCRVLTGSRRRRRAATCTGTLSVVWFRSVWSWRALYDSL